MYGDNLLIPGDCPFDWNGWGVRTHPSDEPTKACIGVSEWQEQVNAVIDAAMVEEAAEIAPAD
jgi:hypothetical protein